MRERQTLPQRSHLCVVSGLLELLPSFLHIPLSSAAFISFSSPAGVYPHTSRKAGKSCSCLPDHLVDLLSKERLSVMVKLWYETGGRRRGRSR